MIHESLKKCQLKNKRAIFSVMQRIGIRSQHEAKGIEINLKVISYWESSNFKISSQ